MVHGTPEFNRRGRLMRRTILDDSTNSLVLIASYATTLNRMFPLSLYFTISLTRFVLLNAIDVFNINL